MEGEVIELRWFLSRAQVAGTFAEPIPWPDGTTCYARLQYRDVGFVKAVNWREIPIESEIVEKPKIGLVPRDAH